MKHYGKKTRKPAPETQDAPHDGFDVKDVVDEAAINPLEDDKEEEEEEEPVKKLKTRVRNIPKDTID